MVDRLCIVKKQKKLHNKSLEINVFEEEKE